MIITSPPSMSFVLPRINSSRLQALSYVVLVLFLSSSPFLTDNSACKIIVDMLSTSNTILLVERKKLYTQPQLLV